MPNEVDDYATPWELFDLLHERFRFTVDVAATPANARLPHFWTKEDDALARRWGHERVWCNPPFSTIDPWVAKAWQEFNAGCELIVMLLPANRTEQPWWQQWIEPHRDRTLGVLSVEFLPGRPRFTGPARDQQASNDNLFGERESITDAHLERPPFGCCLLIWRRPQ
jgi:phage N-6-adenine-methyltransferase